MKLSFNTGLDPTSGKYAKNSAGSTRSGANKRASILAIMITVRGAAQK
jgi:hypothetical protein